MIADYYLLFIFIVPVAVIFLTYTIFRVNLRKASQKPSRRMPTQLKYNRSANREIIFWPKEEDMPPLRRFLRADMIADPQLGPLIMIIYSRIEFWLLLVLNIVICVLCIDSLLGGTLIMTALTYNYLELPKYHIMVVALLVFMFLWAIINVYRASNKILFYEHGIMLMPKHDDKYDYNDIINIDIYEKRRLLRKNVQCQISFKNSRNLLFDSRQYAKLGEKIIFWKKNLLWSN